jgi:phosphoribosylformimino-5-aminoimidazole carboxamide ribotide isomerase
MQIIPAIDIFEGHCVRLVQGVFSDQTNYCHDPYAMAQQFIRSGARYLHVVDLEGTKNGHVINWDSIEKILSLKGLKVQVGGGIRSGEDVNRLLKLGAVNIVLGSVAVQSSHLVELWCRQFGADKFCIALDMKDGFIAYSGWQATEKIEPNILIQRMIDFGITNFLSTDIRRDGTLAGPNLELYKTLVRQFPSVRWLASGGVRSVDDVRALAHTGVSGAVIGKALYEGTLRLEELMENIC